MHYFNTLTFSIVIMLQSLLLPKTAAFSMTAVASLSRRSLLNKTLISTTTTLFSVAPGVMCAPPDEIRNALENNPKTIILDVRGIDEIVQNGYYETDLQWIHAPCSLESCPLLEVAADNLLLANGRDKASTPIIVHCASGKRSTKAKSVLEGLGYKNVLNAGTLGNLQSTD